MTRTTALVGFTTYNECVICKAGPALLIRIRINIVFVLNTSYYVFEPYLSYLTVEKYDFYSKIRISRNTY